MALGLRFLSCPSDSPGIPRTVEPRLLVLAYFLIHFSLSLSPPLFLPSSLSLKETGSSAAATHTSTHTRKGKEEDAVSCQVGAIGPLSQSQRSQDLRPGLL